MAYPKAIDGVLSPTGAVTRTIDVSVYLTGVLSNFSGSVGKHRNLDLTGELVANKITGDVSRIHNVKPPTIWYHVTEGSLPSPSGTLVAQKSVVTLSGQLGTLLGSATPIPNKSLSGELAGPSGVLLAFPLLSPEIEGELGDMSGELNLTLFQEVAGELPELTGELFGGSTEEAEGVLGAITGELTKLVQPSSLTGSMGDYSGGLSYPVLKSLVGQLSPTGELEAIGVTEELSLEGELGSFERTLSITPFYDTTWAPPLNGLANSHNIILEQGASNRMVFKWVKPDGTPYDTARFDFTFVIRPYRGSEELILSSVTGDATITALAGGLIVIEIEESVSALLDFTRATYDLEASSVYGVVRLVAGEVRLDREVAFGKRIQALFGTLSGFSGEVVGKKNEGAILTGSLGEMSGVLETKEPFYLSGEIPANHWSGVLVTEYFPVDSYEADGELGTLEGTLGVTIAIGVGGEISMES